jgi:hypothetical protein
MSEGNSAQSLRCCCCPQELQVHRTWSVDDHPAWLVFEMEGGLQIRPAQHWVAAYLMEHPGSIVQLNMGEGKTRVILPMLILHWANGTNLVCMHALPLNGAPPRS